MWKSKQRSFQDLILSPQQSQDLGGGSLVDKTEYGLKNTRHDMFLGLAEQHLKQTDLVYTEHAVVTLGDHNIIDITSKTLKIEADKIVNDVKK